MVASRLPLLRDEDPVLGKVRIPFYGGIRRDARPNFALQ